MATAVQVESIWNGLTDNSGQPLAAGKVYTYSAGTTTPVSLYTSSDKSTSATNPLILDGNGKAQVWADGRYKFVVKTAADVTLYTLDNLLYGFDDTTVLLGGISTGSANAQTVSVPASVESYANGQRITFIAGYTNTGAVTLQFNALGAISIVKGPTPSSLQAGDLLAGQLYSCTYYGGSFYLENSPTPADVQRSRAQLVASVAGINTITGTTTPALTGYETGSVFRFKAASSNTAAATINISALGAKAIQYNGIALTGSEIQANQYYELVYDGTQFQLLNPTLVADVYATGVAGSDTITATVPAVAGAYTTGMKVWFQAAASNTGATTINLNGLGAKAVQLNGAALAGGEIVSGRWVELVYDGTNFQLSNAAQESAPRWGGTTGGTSTAFTITPSPAIGAYATGQRFAFVAHVANGAAATLAVNGLTATTIQRQGTALAGNEFKANDIIEVVYNGTNFQIVNVSNAPLFVDRTNDRVGIGTTAPATILDVATGASSARFRGANPVVNLQNTSNVPSDGGVLRFDHDQTSAKPLAEIRAQLVDGNVATRAGNLAFFTSTQSSGTLTQKMVLSQDGNFGIGTTAPTSSLCVAGGVQTIPSLAAVHAGVSSSYSLINLTNVNGGYIDFGPTGVDYAGRIIFNNSTNAFQVIAVSNGVQLSSGGTSWAAISDIRFKKNIQPLEYGLDCILSLDPIRFDYLEEDVEESNRIGFSAQNVKEAIPEAVSGDESDRLFLSQTEIIPVLANAIKDLNAKVEALEARVVALEA